jgi:RNA polymerase sigma-70 factor (family 1)
MERTAAKETVFRELFEKEYNGLCRYAMTYMQDSHLAEDVVQDTFIKIWEHKTDLVSSPQIRFYLLTAVKNNCISALRKQNTRGEVFTDTDPDIHPEPFITTRQHYEQLDEQKKKIADALNQLPPKCKEVFLLVKMQGLSYKQAAESLEISVKTVENQMGKAIKTLREHVGTLVLWFILSYLLKFF